MATPHIEVQNLTKSFEQLGKMVPVIDDISFKIEDQDIYGIIGPSGSGKSTLIRCLTRLISPTSGKIFFEGAEIDFILGGSLRHFYQSIGMIFQYFNLFSGRTVEENVAYPLEIAGWRKQDRKKRVDEILSFVGLSEKKLAYPAMLSGGEKQRVGIARALANKSKTLFCDEAMSALDPDTTEGILELLKSANKQLGVTIIMIAHDMDVIKAACNKVAVLENGKIVEEGLVTDVFVDPKSEITKRFVRTTSHKIPKEFFKAPSPNRKLLRLRYKGDITREPFISEIVKKFGVDANVLLSWIDKLQTTIIGTMMVELSGSPECIEKTIQFMREKNIHSEEIGNES